MKKEKEFALFLADKKGVEKRPDFKGYAVIGGVEYELAGWNRRSWAGVPYISGVISERPAAQPQDQAPAQGEKSIS